MHNSFGRLFTVTSFGESHGPCIGVVVDGCPAGLPLTAADIQKDLDRRRPGDSPGATARREKDKVEILSGVLNGFTTGAPVCALIRNEDIDESDYEKIRFKLRPGHADYTAFVKYGGFNDWRGGGRFSGRLTASMVMAGAIARKLLGLIGVEIVAHTVEIGGINARAADHQEIKKKTSKNSLYCADPAAAKKMAGLITRAKATGDSLGGVIEGIALNVPAGLGEPLYDNLDGELAKAVHNRKRPDNDSHQQCRRRARRHLHGHAPGAQGSDKATSLYIYRAKDSGYPENEGNNDKSRRPPRCLHRPPGGAGGRGHDGGHPGRLRPESGTD
jgi:chorismate synthase